MGPTAFTLEHTHKQVINTLFKGPRHAWESLTAANPFGNAPISISPVWCAIGGAVSLVAAVSGGRRRRRSFHVRLVDKHNSNPCVRDVGLAHIPDASCKHEQHTIACVHIGGGVCKQDGG